jgi:hypothetical protein
VITFMKPCPFGSSENDPFGFFSCDRSADSTCAGPLTPLPFMEYGPYLATIRLALFRILGFKVVDPANLAAGRNPPASSPIFPPWPPSNPASGDFPVPFDFPILPVADGTVLGAWRGRNTAVNDPPMSI